MEKYSYDSYADSGDSSPRSREIEFDSVAPAAPPWDNQNYRAKFMCSYGGKILPRPHDNSLCYVGGETKILAVDRAVKLSTMLAKLSALFGGDDVSFKYQLPGEDLDALISVTNDDDLELMMCEHDRLHRSGARMRIFLFPAYAALRRPGFPAADRDVFVEALNLGPILPDSNTIDFLFGLDKYVTPPTPHAVHAPADVGGRAAGRGVEAYSGMYPGDHYYAAGKAVREKIPASGVVPAVQIPVSAGYWPERLVGGGGFPAAVTAPEHPVYVIPATAASATAVIQPPMVRPAAVYKEKPAAYGAILPSLALPISSAAPKILPAVSGALPPAIVPPLTAAAPILSAAAALPYIPPPPPLPVYTASAPPPPPKITAAAYPQGTAVKVSSGFTVVATEAVPYGPVPYSGTRPRHVYYATPGGVVVAPPPPLMPALPQSFAPAAAVRVGGGIGMEGKMVIAKVQQGPVV